MIITAENKRLPTVTADSILGFFGDYRFLSNFHWQDIVVGDIIYPTTEHGYMALKTLDRDIQIYISKIDTPAGARKFGQTIELRPDWETYKSVAMMACNTRKFKDPELKKLLLATGHKYLEESNNWHDNYWGSCWCSKCGNQGKNMLGKTHMLIRDLASMNYI